MDNMENNPSEKRDSLSIPAAIVVAGIIVAISVIATSNEPDPVESSFSATDIRELQRLQKIELANNLEPVTDNDHIRGNPNAPVYIVEFSDTECPFCKSFHNTAKGLMEKFGKDGKLAWVYRHFPLETIHPTAATEAHATECVAELEGEDAFWVYLDSLFEATPTNRALDPALLPQLAVAAGVDESQFRECMDSQRHIGTIENHIADGVTSGGGATPYVIVATRSGKKFPVEGAEPYYIFRRIVELALAEEGE